MQALRFPPRFMTSPKPSSRKRRWWLTSGRMTGCCLTPSSTRGADDQHEILIKLSGDDAQMLRGAILHDLLVGAEVNDSAWNEALSLCAKGIGT